MFETQLLETTATTGNNTMGMIVTIGGIMGKVLSIREDSILIETGADRDKIRIMKWAIQANNSRMPVDTKSSDKKKADEKKSDEKLDKKDDEKK